MKQAVVTDAAPTPVGPYFQAVISDPFISVAGQGPRDPGTGLLPEWIEAQTHQVLRNLRSILSACGASMADIVEVTAHLADLQDFATFNAVYGDYSPEPYLVRTTVGSSLDGILVEIDLIARQPVVEG